jgi:hypothetical protein
MEQAYHPDIPGEALSQSAQRAAQVISLLAGAAQIRAQRKASQQVRRSRQSAQEQRARREQERAALDQARSRWAPAHDPAWLAQADLLQTARTWAGAAAWADADPAAASAMRKSEDHLRRLHPYAMARYDRLRSDGAAPLDAMHEAAPLFGNQPRARQHPGSARTPVTSHADGPQTTQATAASDAERAGQEREEQLMRAERSGRLIVGRLQADALTETGTRLSPDELVTRLEAQTSLPAEVIARLAFATQADQAAWHAEEARSSDLDRAAARPVRRGRHAADLDQAARQEELADTARAQGADERSAAQVAAASFPFSAADGIRTAARAGTRQPARRPAAPGQQAARRPRRSA